MAGSYCTALGSLKQIGQLGVGLITLVWTFEALTVLASQNSDVQLTRFLPPIHL